jgi:Concanavalin A-like lectin/glucanases superfamily
MFRNLSSSASRYVAHAVWVCAVAAAPLAADAAVVHKYTFNNGTAADSVGGADGQLIDNTGIASFAGGLLNLTANTTGSNQDFSLPTTVGAFVDLPNNILMNAFNGGTSSQASLEIWFTVQEHRDWAEVFSFGNNGPDAMEGISDGGADQDYVALIPRSGGGNNDFRATTKAAAGDPEETPIVITPTPLPLHERHHVVMTFDLFDDTAGPNGTASVYLNNGAPVSGEIRPFIDFLNDNNNWLGRSPWPDSLFDGTIDEFRIYDHTLSEGEVASSFTTGPEPAALPVLVVNRDTGAVSIANQSGSGITLKGYTIGSAAGSLDPTAWTSIDAGNVFDNNGTWTAQSSTTLSIAESVTGGTTDGGMLAASSSRGIGLPWEKTRFEDLTFSFTLGDNSVGSGLVQYTGTAVSRSDLNGDGNVNVADWTLFVPNSSKSFAGETQVAAFLKGDLDGDLDNDYNDFRIFKADFVAANGLAAFNALGFAVPEPSSAILIGIACVGLVGYRHR